MNNTNLNSNHQNNIIKYRNVKEVTDFTQANDILLKNIKINNYYDIAFESINDDEVTEYENLLQNTQNDTNSNKSKTIINKIPKKTPQQQQQPHGNGNNNNKIVFKLKTPMETLKKKNIDNQKNNTTLFINKIQTVYKDENSTKQPLLLGGNQAFKVSSINDYSPKLLEAFLSKQGVSTKNVITSTSPALSTSSGNLVSSGSTSGVSANRPRQLQLKANVSALYNDSFDLSFDGKAMDRSDVFRMVDSFSVAFSDNDDSNIMMQNTQSVIIQEGRNRGKRKNNKQVDGDDVDGKVEDGAENDQGEEQDDDNNIESTKNESQINGNDDLADAGSSDIIGPIDNNESSFIVNPSDNILPAEITSSEAAY